jgi:drug/metabolite transporter (DMT)-like permease
MDRKPDARAYVALACVCVFWGTTYLGIRMGLEAFPPATLVAARFTISGGLLVLFALARGYRLPPARELWQTAFYGFLILGLGNGSLAYAELLIPSGLASLFITISPFWLVGVESLMPGGEKLHGPTIAGMVVGFLGTALLVTPDWHSSSSGVSINIGLLAGFAITQFGVASWCSGSILQKRQPTRAAPILTLGLQQLAAGLAFIPVALLIPSHPIHWSVRGLGAVAYLVIFGSWIGYSAFIYGLAKFPVAIFSVYPYVNCVVAVALGWMVYREPFGLKETVGMLIIFTGVGIVKWQTSIKRPSTEAVLAHDRD